ncbi:hypothetical protein PQX77_000914 [Marasmius sp. AFHP31]|nr:hypothetical protein PQX77_000914 [Marasmius sp. AFHP31]
MVIRLSIIPCTDSIRCGLQGQCIPTPVPSARKAPDFERLYGSDQTYLPCGESQYPSVMKWWNFQKALNSIFRGSKGRYKNGIAAVGKQFLAADESEWRGI